MKRNGKFAESIFTRRCPTSANINQIADAASATWRDISNALSPVIGQHGVVALIKRSLYLQHTHYPMLQAISGSRILPGEFPALHAVLLKETNTDAVLINNAILNTFYELLTNLIGTSVTDQLLHSLIATPSSGNPVQDTLL